MTESVAPMQCSTERHVYKGDHSCPVQQYFSIYEQNQEVVQRYPELTKDDRPAGPFHETAMSESRIFVLVGSEGEGSAGFPTRNEVLQALTDVAWSFEWTSSGQYALNLQVRFILGPGEVVAWQGGSGNEGKRECKCPHSV